MAKIGDGKPGPGRPKGSRNRVGQSAKEVVQAVFDGIGGADRLRKWILLDPKNEADYWTKIYPKLLPLQLDGKVDHAINWPLAKPKIEQ